MGSANFYNLSLSNNYQDNYVHTSANHYLNSLTKMRFGGNQQAYLTQLDKTFNSFLGNQIAREKKIQSILGVDVVEKMQKFKDKVKNSPGVNKSNLITKDNVLKEVDLSLGRLKQYMKGDFDSGVRKMKSVENIDVKKFFTNGVPNGKSPLVSKLYSLYIAYVASLEQLYQNGGVSADNSAALQKLAIYLGKAGDGTEANFYEVAEKISQGEYKMNEIGGAITYLYGNSNEAKETIESIEPLVAELTRKEFNNIPGLKGKIKLDGQKGGKADSTITFINIIGAKEKKIMEIGVSMKSTAETTAAKSGISIHSGTPLKNAFQAIEKSQYGQGSIIKYYEQVITFVLTNYFKLIQNGSWRFGDESEPNLQAPIKDPRMAYLQFRQQVLRPFFGAYLSIFIGEEIKGIDSKLGKVDILTLREKVIWKSELLTLMKQSAKEYLQKSAMMTASIAKPKMSFSTDLKAYDDRKRALASANPGLSNDSFYSVMKNDEILNAAMAEMTNVILESVIVTFKLKIRGLDAMRKAGVE